MRFQPPRLARIPIAEDGDFYDAGS
jgi:hypothetical protein